MEPSEAPHSAQSRKLGVEFFFFFFAVALLGGGTDDIVENSGAQARLESSRGVFERKVV